MNIVYATVYCLLNETMDAKIKSIVEWMYWIGAELHTTQFWHQQFRWVKSLKRCNKLFINYSFWINKEINDDNNNDYAVPVQSCRQLQFAMEEKLWWENQNDGKSHSFAGEEHHEIWCPQSKHEWSIKMFENKPKISSTFMDFFHFNSNAINDSGASTSLDIRVSASLKR